VVLEENATGDLCEMGITGDADLQEHGHGEAVSSEALQYVHTLLVHCGDFFRGHGLPIVPETLSGRQRNAMLTNMWVNLQRVRTVMANRKFAIFLGVGTKK
jgi:hypothetical protein